MQKIFNKVIDSSNFYKSNYCHLGALALLDQCYHEDDVNATQILTCELENWSNWTCLDLSVTAYLRDFVAHKCCQQLLSDLWIGGMNVRKYLKWMVLLALFFPPALFLIDFKSSQELQLMPQTEEEYFQSKTIEFLTRKQKVHVVF
jgi:transient receptor potential cation channel subfamily M protein 3